jgi:hypothetical protein
MTVTSFGQVIPVTGPNLGFPGTISRQGERVAPSRQFNPFSSSYNLNFGDPTILLENASGGSWTSVLDAVTDAVANIALVATQFAGIAVREVQTQLAYPFGAGIVPGQLQVGYYSPGQMADVLERGSATILASVSNSPVAGGPVYTRVVLNSAVTAGTVGDWEVGTPAATDLFQEETTLTQGSTSATVGAGTNIQVGMVVKGPGIADGTYVAAISGTAVTLSQAAIATFASTGALLTYSNLVLVPFAVLRTGLVDVNSVVEITLKTRNQA